MCATRRVVKKAAPKKRVAPKKVMPAKKAASAKRACENAIADRETALAERERALQIREETLLKLERESDERIAAARARLVEELSEKRIAAEKEISDRKEQELDKIEREVADVRSDIRARKQELDVQENDLKTRERSLERRAQRIEESAQARSAELDEEVQARTQDVRRSLESQLDTCRKENARLLESLNAQTELAEAYNALTKLLGGKEPAEIRKLLDEQTRTIAQLRKEIVDHQRLEAIIYMPSGVFKPYSGVSTAVLVFTKTNAGGTDDVWLYNMEGDGFTLDDKRDADPTHDDIPDILERWGKLDAERERSHTDKSFLVPAQEIRDNDYDFSFNKYTETVYERIEYPPTEEILADLEAINQRMAKGLDTLRAMLAKEAK